MHFLSKSEAIEFVNERMGVFEDAERTNPFSGAAWTKSFLEHVAEESWTFAIPECFSGGESLMLLYSDEKHPGRRSAAVSYLESHFSPLVSNIESAQERTQALESLVEQLTRSKPGCSCIKLSPLNAADAASLQRLISARGWYVREYDCFGNWHLPCANVSFKDFMAGRSSKLLNTWTRKQRKFDQLAGARMEVVVTPGGFNSAMDAFEAIYSKSWKKPEPYHRFVRAWASVCANNGWLRLGLAWLEDTPVAAQIWFTMHGKAYIFKLAYDEAHANLSAGTLLTAHLFQQALDVDHVTDIDFMTGDDEYKQTWMSHRRQRVGLVAYNPWTIGGFFGGAKELAGAVTKPLRNLLPA